MSILHDGISLQSVVEDGEEYRWSFSDVFGCFVVTEEHPGLGGPGSDGTWLRRCHKKSLTCSDGRSRCEEHREQYREANRASLATLLYDYQYDDPDRE